MSTMTGPTGHAVAQGRYTAVAVALHWAIAVLIFLQLASGILLHRLPDGVSWAGAGWTLHKSFGLSVLLLALVRLAWRLTHRAPPLPEGTSQAVRVLSRATQVVFYVLIIAVPLAGWLLTSAGTHPTTFFFLVPVPSLPGTGLLPRGVWSASHEYMAFTILGLLVLHVAGALKHHFVDRDGVMARMVPGMARTA